MQVDTVLGGGIRGAAGEARRAERLGFDMVSSSEIAHDPFLPLVPAALETERIRLCTSIAVAFARSPMTTAYSAWDLAQLSDGRFDLGLGSQVKAHIRRRFAMPWSEPAERMRDYVLALRAIWASWRTGEPLRFEGRFTAHTLMTPVFTPTGRHEPRVLVAAVGARMTEATASVADGLLLHRFTTPRYVREVTLPAVAAARRAGGREDQPFTIRASPFLVTGSDEAEMAAVAARVKEQIAFYASTPSYRAVLDLHGWGALHDELHRLSIAGQWRAMGGLIDDDVLREFAVVAEPELLAGALAGRIGGLADRVSLLVPAPVPDELIAGWVRALHAVPNRGEVATGA